VVICRAGERGGSNQDRNSPQSASHYC
jgi:hypothetical protein